MTSCKSKITGFQFSENEIKNAVQSNKLLSMEIEFSLRCNFKCPYCYIPQNSFFEKELSTAEIKDTILQAKGLGVKKIIILGGEPTLYPDILDMIRFIRNQNIEVEMFTNGSKITPDFASHLFSENVNVVLKMNSFHEALQDKLTGIKGSYKIIQNALETLVDVGFTSNNSLLKVSTIICRQNIDELPDMWVWLKDRNIAPYFEIITPQEKAKKNRWLEVSSKKHHALFKKIAKIDQERYGLSWDPQPPLLGNQCMRHQFSCLITSLGHVMPCVGVAIQIGNIREKKLSEILKNSSVMKHLKNHRQTIKGECSRCDKAATCYGCRGAAYQLTGDYLASDPTCWRINPYP